MADTTLDERFTELRRLVDAEIAGARRAVIEALTRGVARMRAASNEAEWTDAVLESGRPFADDPAALELLASLAALTLPAAPPQLASDFGAQRFAKVKVAEIQLYQAAAVKAGRQARDLYGSLKQPIDAAREAFKDRFGQNGNASIVELGVAKGDAVDHLHAELVRALANDDATMLGPDYPGPLA